MQTIDKMDMTVTEGKPSVAARVRNRVAALFAMIAALVAVPAAAAFAQTTPTLPDAGTTSNTLVNQGGSQLATAVLAVLPAVITLTVLFWAINFALKKIGVRGRAASVH